MKNVYLSFIKIYLKIFLRNWRRGLVISLGIVLATSLIISMNLLTDSIARDVIERTLSEVYADIVITPSEDVTFEEIKEVPQILGEIQGVNGVEVVARLAEVSTKVKSDIKEILNPNLCLVNYSLFEKYDASIIQGSSSDFNSSNVVMLTENLAVSLNISVGDQVKIEVLSKSFPSLSFNVTVTVVGIVKLGVFSFKLVSFEAEVFKPEEQKMSGIFSENFVFFSLDAWDDLKTLKTLSVRVFVFLDRNLFVNFWEPGRSINKIWELEDEISAKLPFECYIDSPLVRALERNIYFVPSIQPVFYGLSIPILILCWYLTLTSLHIFVLDSRQDLGLIIARGAPHKEVFKMVLISAIVIGVLGGALGCFVAYFAGYLILVSLFKMSPRPVSLVSVTYNIVISLFIGIILAFLAARKPASQVFSTSPVEASMAYVVAEEEAEVDWKPSKGLIVLVVLSVLKMVEWIFGVNPEDFWPYFAKDPLLNIIFGIYMFLSAFLQIFAPFIFIYGVTVIVIRSQVKLFKITSAILKPLLKDFSTLVSKNIVRSPSRFLKTSLIVSLVFSIVTWSIITVDSYVTFLSKVDMVRVGSDIRVTLGSSYVNEFKLWLSEKNIIDVYSQVYMLPTSRKMTICAIDPSSLSRTIYTFPDMFQTLSPYQVFEEMEKSVNKAVITKSLAENFDINPNSTLTLEIDNVSLDIKILDIANYLPGLEEINPNNYVVLLNYRYVSSKILNSTDILVIFFIRLKDRGGSEEFLRELVGREGVIEISVLSGIKGTSSTGPELFFLCLSRAAYISSIYSVLVAFLGLSLVSFTSVHRRVKDIASMRARGLSTFQAFLLLFGEMFTIIVLSFPLGFTVGLLAARGYIFVLRLPAPFVPTLVISWNFLVILLTLHVLLLIACVVPAFLITRKDIVKTLRII